MESHLFKLEDCELLKEMKIKILWSLNQSLDAIFNVAMWPTYIYWSLHDKVKTLVVNEWENIAFDHYMLFLHGFDPILKF